MSDVHVDEADQLGLLGQRHVPTHQRTDHARRTAAHMVRQAMVNARIQIDHNGYADWSIRRNGGGCIHTVQPLPHKREGTRWPFMNA